VHAQAGAAGDRPDVVPAKSGNLAFGGPFTELPQDVVFTVAYSVRAALTAAACSTLIGRCRPSRRTIARSK